MIENNFKTIATDNLNVMIAAAEQTLTMIELHMGNINKLENAKRRLLLKEHAELSTWLAQAWCEIFERTHIQRKNR